MMKNSNNSLINTVLFDLDGTVLDTALDLVGALNIVMQEQGLIPVSLEKARPSVSLGAAALISCGFGYRGDEPDFETLRQRLVTVYSEHIADYTCLFDGMDEVLTTLESKNIRWGIVTNKITFLTESLLEKLDLTKRCACVVSGDTLPQKKPHPAPLLHACQLAQSQPTHCIYVGDAARDIEAGQRAGMQTIAALYGYIAENDNPYEWNATATISKPLDLLNWLELC